MTSPDHAAELAQINASIAEIRAELKQHGERHPQYGELRLMLGLGRMIRFSLTGQRADLDAAITDLTAAVAAIPPHHALRGQAVSGLIQALTDRFQRTDSPADLDAAITLARDAAATIPVGRADRAVIVASLAMALEGRYERLGQLADLDESISQFKAALAGMGEAGLGRTGTLSNLGVALRVRFERTGNPGDLAAAIDCGQAAVAASQPADPDRVDYLSNLAMAFLRRFQHTDALSDADDAITALRAATAAMPPGFQHRAGMLSNLTVALLSRYQRSDDSADLDQAVRAGQEAVRVGDRADPRWAGMAANASVALCLRYKRTGDAADLEAAVDLARAGAAATPAGRPDYAVHQTDLGAALHARFERTCDISDLQEAIRAAHEALSHTPVGHPERAETEVNLGVTLRTRYRLTGLPHDREASMDAFISVTATVGAPPSMRARAAVAAAMLAQEGDDLEQSATLLGRAISLLAEVAPRQLGRGDQQHSIARFAGVAAAAASAALADPRLPEGERPVKALALLEAGRAVLLSQSLATRDDLTDLRGHHRDLADRFVRLRARLDQPDRAVPLPGDPLTSLGREAGESERLAAEFAQAIGEIRALDGFERFGLPPSSDELLAEAAEGPVVTFTVSARGGGALLLTVGGIRYLPLPGLTLDAVTAQVNAFHRALGEARGDDEAAAESAEEQLSRVLEWLWDTAGAPVLDALDRRRRPAAGGRWPRVWWVPGGLLGLLPLHAAGYHQRPCDPGEQAHSVLDAVVSSYTPTVRALRYARQQARHRADPGRILVVAMPVTPGQRRLPGAGAEAAAVCGVLPASVVLAEPEPDERQAAPDNVPTKENVFRYLPACTIAHFACHADSDAADPSRSLLLLHDYRTAPLTVEALAQVDHERLELTYLSACSTAFTAATELADEAIHLTSAFLLAGSRHVVGTLWPTQDLVALSVATGFYNGLRPGGGELSTDRAAVALHDAVRETRQTWRGHPSLWATFLHAGA